MNKASVLAFIDDEIDRLQKVRLLLGAVEVGIPGSARYPRRRGAWHMSAEARARISAAQKARWARRKAGISGTGTRRKMSTDARARIAAAQRARWARQREGQKKK